MNNFILKTYDDFTLEDKEIFFNFCRYASKETKELASVNMWARNTFVKPWTLGYRLESTKEFHEPNGKFYVLYHDNEVIGCSGIHVSEFHPLIFSAGVRTWIKKEYRNQSINKKYFFPEQRAWAVKKNAKIIFLSFNDYNKNLIQVFKRNRLGENKERVTNRNKNDLFSNGLKTIDFPLIINKTKQWICYETIDKDFDYDWNSLAYSDNKKEEIYTKDFSKRF